MGINGINKLGKRSASDAFITIPITSLAKLRISIDGNHWMYTNRAIARKKVINRTDVALGPPDEVEIRREWFLIAINFVIGWLSNDITPVFSFDGKHPPEKTATKAKRSDARKSAKAKIDALYEQLNGDILSQSANLIEELRKELRNYNFIPYEDFELFKMVMKGIGVPCFQARGDGEHLCSSFCIEGKVAAVFSEDTDNLVYGCPLLITGYSDQFSYDEHGYKVQHLDCVRLDRLLAGLNLSHSSFVDLCIMSGCDFNTNMPGIAVIKSYNLIKQYGSIDNLPPQYNTACLNHVRCRQIFQYAPSSEVIVADDSEPEQSEFGNANVNPLDLNKSALAVSRDYLEMAGVSGQIQRLIVAYEAVSTSQDGYVQSLNLAPAPRYVPPIQPPKKPLTLNIVQARDIPMPFVSSPKLVETTDPKTGAIVKILKLAVRKPSS